MQSFHKNRTAKRWSVTLGAAMGLGVGLALAALSIEPKRAMAQAGQGLKIGIVDLDLARTRSQSIQRALRSVDDELKTKEDELEALIRQFNRAREDLDARQSAMSSEAVRKAKNNINDLQSQLQQLRLDIEEKWRRSTTEVMEPAVDRILNAINTVAKRHQFDLILHSEVVLYRIDRFDVTPFVIEELDHPVGTANSSALPGAADVTGENNK